MKTARSIAILGLTMSSWGCGGRCEDSRCAVLEEQQFDDNASYQRLNDGFDDPAQCPTDGLPNCYAVFELCMNGGFQLMLEDIIEGGKWEHDGDNVTATLHLASGTQTFTATVAPDGTLTSEDVGGVHPWIKVPLDATQAAQLDSSCEALEGRFWW